MLWKLVSNIEGSRWSFMNGHFIFGNVVWLSSKDDVKKYTLIDENGEKIENINYEDLLVEEKFS